MKKYLGRVSESDRNIIYALHKHINSLTELMLILPPDENLFQTAQTDLVNTQNKYNNWWNEMSTKYQWESSENGNWEINFDTCEIFLVEGQCSCKNS